MIPIAKPQIGEEEKQAVMEVLDSGMLAQGEKVKALEEAFAHRCKTKHAVAMSSGTAGLHAALACLGIKEGDEVITTPFTFVASANSILMAGAKPVFADIEEDTFNISLEKIKEKITAKTKAIMPVHIFGQICDPKIIAMAKERGLLVVEDACQAINASVDEKFAGGLGDAGVFSLYGTKNICSGEGGVVTTDNDEVADKLRRFRHHGQDQQYYYSSLGYNYRMTDVHAAIGLAQIKKLDEFTERRQENAKLMAEGLQRIPGIILPTTKVGKHVYHQFTIRIHGFKLTREELQEKLKEEGIGSAVFYPKPLHLHPLYAGMGYKEGDFPVAEKAAQQVLSLPIHPGVTLQDIVRITQTISKLGGQ